MVRLDEAHAVEGSGSLSSEAMPVVTELRRFPVKSCRGEVLDEAVVEPFGLRGDRRWMLVDDHGEAVTIRERKGMVLLHPALRATAACWSGTPTARTRTSWPWTSRPAPTWSRSACSATHRSWPRWPTTPRTSGSARRSASRCGWCTPTTPRAGRRTRRTPARACRWRSPTATRCTWPPRSRWRTSTRRSPPGPMADQGPLPMVRFRPNIVVAGAPRLGRRRLAPDPDRRRRLPRGQGLRPLHHPDHRPRDRRAVQGADRDHGPHPPLGRAGVVRHQPGLRHPGRDHPGRRRGRGARTRTVPARLHE